MGGDPRRLRATGPTFRDHVRDPSGSPFRDQKFDEEKKKWKEKSFAAGANRELIAAGAEILGEPLDEVIAETLTGMQAVAAEIGLAGDQEH